LALALVTSTPVEAAGEDVDDCNEIFNEFSLWALSEVIENHNLAARPLDDVADKLEAEASQSVFVGNHNAELLSAH